MAANLEPYHRHQLPGRVAIVAGNGGLPKLVITTPASQAEIYAHGAHITHFQKPGEPPLLFLSQRSRFAPGQPIRGGVPICFPWFGGRAGEPSHGFARLTEWQLVHTAAAPDGTVTVRFALPDLPGRAAWKSLRTGFTVIVGDTLAMELAVTNESGETLDFENCLHTYFHVSDIASVSLTGLQQTAFLDNAAGGRGERKSRRKPACASPPKPTASTWTPPARWKSAMNNSPASSAWKNPGRNPPWSGTRGPRKSCPRISTRRNTGTWFAWKPAT